MSSAFLSTSIKLTYRCAKVVRQAAVINFHCASLSLPVRFVILVVAASSRDDIIPCMVRNPFILSMLGHAPFAWVIEVFHLLAPEQNKISVDGVSRVRSLAGRCSPHLAVPFVFTDGPHFVCGEKSADVSLQ